MKKILENPPLAYHIIFRVNSTWCHGDDKLSIDPKHNQVGEPKLGDGLCCCKARCHTVVLS